MAGPLLCLLLAAPPVRIPPRPRGTPVLPPLTTTIQLAIKSGGAETSAVVKPGQTPAASRPVVSLKAGEKPQIRWTIKNTDPKKPVEELVVHFLITRQDRVGAPIPPPPPQVGSLTDSVLGTTLTGGAATTGDFNTPIHKPGIYLVELELLDGQGNRRQYCALDLKVE